MSSAKGPPRSLRLWASVSLGLFTLGLLPAICASGVGNGGDFPIHVQHARTWRETGHTELPHFLFQAATLAVDGALRFGTWRLPFACLAGEPERGLTAAALLVCWIAEFALAWLLFRRVEPLVGGGVVRRQAFAAAIAAGLLIAAPVSVFGLSDRRLYLGYVGMSVYHNPTGILLRPLALAFFWRVTRAIGPEDINRKQAAVLVCLALLCAAAKPSFTVCLLPALAALALSRRLWGHAMNPVVLLVTFAPSLFALAFQQQAMWQRNSSVVAFAPLGVMRYFSASGLGERFALSVLFPLSFLLVRGRRALADHKLRLAWITFLVGAALAYLFEETGDRRSGNLLWSAQIGLFVLFVQSCLSLLEVLFADSGPRSSRRRLPLLACLATLSLHIASGAVWLAAETFQPHRWWGSPGARAPRSVPLFQLPEGSQLSVPVEPNASCQEPSRPRVTASFPWDRAATFAFSTGRSSLVLPPQRRLLRAFLPERPSAKGSSVNNLYK